MASNVDLGDLELAIKAETKSLVQAAKEIRGLNTTMSSAQKSINSSMRSMEKKFQDIKTAAAGAAKAQSNLASTTDRALIRQERAVKAANIQYRNFESALRRGKVSQAEYNKIVGEVEAALDVYTRRLSGGALTTRAFGRAQDAFKSRMAGARRMFLDYNATLKDKAAQQAAEETKTFANRMQDLTKSTQVALGPLSGVASRISAITALATANNAAVALVVGGIIGFGAAVFASIKAGAQFEVQLQQLEFRSQLLGESFGATGKQLNQMARDLASRTTSSSTEARKAIMILTSATNISADTLRRTLLISQDLADVGLGSLESNATKLAKVLADPKKASEAFQESGIKLTETLKEQIRVFTELGDVGKAHEIILSELEKKFKGTADSASKTLLVSFNRLKETLTQFLETSSHASGTLKVLTEDINKVDTAFKALLTEQGGIEAFGNAVRMFSTAISGALVLVAENIDVLAGAILGLIGARIGVKLLSWIAALIGALGKLSAAVGAVAFSSFAANVTRLLHPIGLLITAAGIAAGVYYALSERSDGATTATKELTSAITQQINAINGMNSSPIDDLVANTEKARQRLAEIRKHIADLQKAPVVAAQPGDSVGFDMATPVVPDNSRQIEQLKKDAAALEKTIEQAMEAILENTKKATQGLTFSIDELNDSMLRIRDSAADYITAQKSIIDQNGQLQRAQDILNGTFKVSNEQYQKLVDQLMHIVPSAKDAGDAVRILTEQLNQTPVDAAIYQNLALAQAWSEGAARVQEVNDKIAIHTALVQAKMIPANTQLGRELEHINPLLKDQAFNLIRQTQTATSAARAVQLLSEAYNASQTPLEKHEEKIRQLNELMRQYPEHNALAQKGIQAANKELLETDPILSKINDGFDGLAKTMVDAGKEGENALQSLSNAASRVVDEILETFLQLAVTNPIKNAIFGTAFQTLGSLTSGWFNSAPSNFLDTTTGAALDQSLLEGGFAKGGAWRGGVRFLAKGGVVNSPTLFGSKEGMNVAGEAGTEGVFPLARTSGGDLGIKGMVTQAPVVINIINNSDAQVTSERKKDSNGGESIEIMIDRIMSKNIRDGGLTSRAISQTFDTRMRTAGR